MFVYYVTIQVPTSNKYRIDDLYQELGGDVPAHLALDGGNWYVFCLQSDVVYEKLIKKYDFILYTSVMSKVEDEHYNRKHRVHLGVNHLYELRANPG